METFAPRFEVPDTDKFATPVIGPSISALALIVRLLPLPATVETVLTELPASVVSASKVTAPE